MHDDNKKSPGTTPPDHLLDELTSIKDLLGARPGAAAIDPADIPLLDDVVGLGQPPLLDIEHIFDDDEAEDRARREEVQEEMPFPFPKFTLDVTLSDAPPAPPPLAEPAALLEDITATLRANYQRELLIQELIDEFLPRIEAELRERLGQLDHATLQALARRD